MGRSEKANLRKERGTIDANLKRGQQHPLKRRSKSTNFLCALALAGVASFLQTEQPGSAGHLISGFNYDLRRNDTTAFTVYR